MASNLVFYTNDLFAYTGGNGGSLSFYVCSFLANAFENTSGDSLGPSFPERWLLSGGFAPVRGLIQVSAGCGCLARLRFGGARGAVWALLGTAVCSWLRLNRGSTA